MLSGVAKTSLLITSRANSGSLLSVNFVHLTLTWYLLCGRHCSCTLQILPHLFLITLWDMYCNISSLHWENWVIKQLGHLFNVTQLGSGSQSSESGIRSILCSQPPPVASVLPKSSRHTYQGPWEPSNFLAFSLCLWVFLPGSLGSMVNEIQKLVWRMGHELLRVSLWKQHVVLCPFYSGHFLP